MQAITLEEKSLVAANDPSQVPIGDSGRLWASLVRFVAETPGAKDTCRIAVYWNEVEYRKDGMTESAARALWTSMPSAIGMPWLRVWGFDKVQDP